MKTQIRSRRTGLEAAVFVLAVLALVLAWGGRANARGRSTETDYLAEYEAIFYDSYDGLVSAEINAITQTEDGYIWVGTYSGLYLYDGFRFEKIELDKRICNVMALFVDSKGRLWVGTNDTGLGVLEPKTRKMRFFTVEDGLSSYSIRSICEATNGDIYVGTVSTLSVIHPDYTVESYDEWEEINGIRSLAVIDAHTVGGVTNSGILFFVRDGELTEQHQTEEPGVYYTAVSRNGIFGNFIVGTSAAEIERFTWRNGKAKSRGIVRTGDVMYFNDIMYDAHANGFFFCAENGMGFLRDRDSRITYMMQKSFESSVSGVIKDYQGNIWFVSNKQGVIEYSKNPFMDVFVKAQMKGAVVNSVARHDNRVYIGTDEGIRILDTNTFHRVHYDFEERLEGVRIRHIMEDSKGNIWISTYGVDGLLEVSPRNKITVYNEEKGGTLGGRFRYCMELKDGTVVAASNLGLNYIKDGKIIKTMGEQDGLEAAQILTMVQREDGTILAGSDGGGIYEIEDQEVVGHTDEGEGLTTLVVLRIVPCGNGDYLYVTSNALFYDDGKGHIRKLDKFPYTNNYDCFLPGDDKVWISSSAGIYIVRFEDLIENGDYNYRLLDNSQGFTTSLTANAWNEVIAETDSLLLCCTDGVRQIAIRDYEVEDDGFFIRLDNLMYGETNVADLRSKDGVYTIPQGKGRIQILPSILNYSLSNPLIHMYLEGSKDEGLTTYQNNMNALEYTNLPYGKYKLHVSVLNAISNEVMRDEVFTIYKKPAITELLAVRVLFFLLLMFAVGFSVWYVIRVTIISRQYDQIKEARDEAERANSAKSRFLANMSHEIRTPINTIMGMDQMILRENIYVKKDDYIAKITEYAKSIGRASESLLGLVNDILDLSKIESGKMNLVEQEYETEDLLRAICTMIRVRSDEKGLTFTTDIDPTIPVRLYGDDGKIKQVVLNLLTNAVKYTEKGSFTLSMKVESRDEEGIRIHFAVKDTGIGIRPEDMDKLFSAFERLEEKRNSGIQGTGLGLDISQQFVELMGDELRCDSVYGEGSTFYFTIRQKVVDGEPLGEFTETETGADTGGAYVPMFVAPEAKVLVVDDNEMNLVVMGGLLGATAVGLDTAQSGMECLEKLEKNRYDIVLLDHMMPGMDGVETLHEIKNRGIDVCTIALTANSATSGEEYYLGEGFAGYLAKPVDGRKLEETLASFLPQELLQDPAGFVPESGEEDSGEDDLFDEIAGVEGLSLADGIRFCGSKPAFMNALHTFVETLRENADEIEKAYEDRNIEFYTIKVHALKSSARILGIAELSKLAEEMEDAGKAGDEALIDEKTGTLLSMYRAYEERFAFLPSEEDEEEAGEDDRPPVDEATLADAYGALEDVAAMMDLDSVEMILESMEEFRLPPEDAKRFSEIEKLSKKLDWDGITKLLNDRK